MKLDELTIGEAKQLAAMFGGSTTAQPHPYEIGKNYFIRTVTHHLTGRMVAVYEHELVIEDAAWIADDGRFTPALESGAVDEVEPFPVGPLVVGRGSIIDAKVISWALPRSQR